MNPAFKPFSESFADRPKLSLLRSLSPARQNSEYKNPKSKIKLSGWAIMQPMYKLEPVASPAPKIIIMDNMMKTDKNFIINRHQNTRSDSAAKPSFFAFLSLLIKIPASVFAFRILLLQNKTKIDNANFHKSHRVPEKTVKKTAHKQCYRRRGI